MGSKAVPAVLSSAAFSRLGPHDYLLGLVQLLWPFADCLAIVRFRTTANVGAVSLSWNSAAYRLVADVIASRARISTIGICGGKLILGPFGGGFLGLGAKSVFSLPVAN